jgi:hypothetical protein
MVWIFLPNLTNIERMQLSKANNPLNVMEGAEP